MILIGQRNQVVIPYPCAVHYAKYNASEYAVYATYGGYQHTLACYSSVIPAKMEVARLVAILEQPKEQWPASFTFVKEVNDE